ncbi:MAG: transposase [Candidatus Contendobacter sp.]|nr:transposase [Candidatus Contendobacter sp.]MDS4059021.1 transposase [Candidatus Contendobacter sp.]
MQRLPRGVYTKEFREQAVRLVLEEGLPIPQAGQRLSMSPKTLANGVGAARRGELAVLGGRRKPSTERARELGRLRRELAEVKMERDI